MRHERSEGNGQRVLSNAHFEFRGGRRRCQDEPGQYSRAINPAPHRTVPGRSGRAVRNRTEAERALGADGGRTERPIVRRPSDSYHCDSPPGGAQQRLRLACNAVAPEEKPHGHPAGPLMVVLRSTRPVQRDILGLLNGRAAQPRVQCFPDRRRGAAFVRRYVVEAFGEGMHGGDQGPWRVGWQRRVWYGADIPEWAPLVICGRYGLAVHTVAEAIQVRAMLNWFCIPEPVAADRRGGQRGRRPRVDRRGRALNKGGCPIASAPFTLLTAPEAGLD